MPLRRLYLCLLTCLPAAPLAAAPMYVPEDAVANRYIVVLEPEAVAPDDTGAVKSGEARREAARQRRVARQAEAMTRRHRASLKRVFEHGVPAFEAEMNVAQAAVMALDAEVKYVEQDGRVRLYGAQSAPPAGLDRVDGRDLPLDGQYAYDADGRGVHAYVVDSGIRASHVDFGGRVGNGASAVNDGRGVSDCNGHGTHVAGTLGGTLSGVAKQVTLHPVRVVDCEGNGTNSSLIAGLNWVVANHLKPAVVNVSLGGGASQAVDDAVAATVARGVTLVAAAGNEGTDACTLSPSRAPAALTVGAVDAGDARPGFSNFGACLDLFAPGVGIFSAWYTADNAGASLTGTSMAAPHVAGAAALYLSAHPQATPAAVASALTANATPGRLSGVGAGSPNRLLYTRLSVPADAPPVASFAPGCTGLSCAFDARGSGDDRGVVAYAWAFGDGRSAAGAQVSHAYAAAGSYAVTLTVTDSAGQTARQTRTVAVSAAPCINCASYSGSLTGYGAYQYNPGGNGYANAAGVQRGTLVGPAGANYDLYLEKLGGLLFPLLPQWTVVASSRGTGANEKVEYNGGAGTYRWRVQSSGGSGAYSFYLQPAQ